MDISITSQPLSFNYRDALILYSVYRPAAIGKEVSFRDILSFYDYINHDVLTWEELSESAGRLLVTGWIHITPQTICATAAYHEWRSLQFKKKKSPSIHKELKEIEAFLKLNFNALLSSSSHVVFFDRQAFDAATKKYLSGAE